MGPKIVGLWEMAENNSFEASLRGFEDTTPIDLSSLDSRHDIRVAQMENNRRRRVKQIMDKSLGIQPLKREFYEYLSADRPGISNRAPFEGLVVSIVRFHTIYGAICLTRVLFSLLVFSVNSSIIGIPLQFQFNGYSLTL